MNDYREKIYNNQLVSVSVFGLGYVGSTTAACLARNGHPVIGIDVEEENRDSPSVSGLYW